MINNLLNSLTIKANAGDRIEYELYARFFQDNDTVVSRSLIFPHAIASTGEDSVVQSKVFFNFKDIKNVYLFDIVGKQKGDKYRNIPTGLFPTNFDVYVTDNTREVGIEVKYRKEDVEINDTLSIVICPETASSFTQCKELSFDDKYLDFGKSVFHYKSGQVVINENYARVCLISRNKTTNLLTGRGCAKTDEDKELFRNLISLSGNNVIYGGEWHETGYFQNDRYSIRDGEVGGDDWVSYSHRNLFGSMTGTIARFTVGGSLKFYDILFNDFNGIQGFDSRLESDLGHSDHNDGLSVDIRWAKTNEITNSSFGYQSTKEITSTEDAIAIENFLNNDNLSQYVEELYVVSKDFDLLSTQIKTRSVLSDFANYVDSTCLSSGDMMRDVIKNKEKHKDHFHVKLRDLEESGNKIESSEKVLLDIENSFEENYGEDSISYSFNFGEGYNIDYYYLKRLLPGESSTLATRVSILIPSEETDTDPVYIDSQNSIRVSQLFVKKKGINEYFVRAGDSLLARFDLKALISNDLGCANYEAEAILSTSAKVSKLTSNEINLNFHPHEVKNFKVDLSEMNNLNEVMVALKSDTRASFNSEIYDKQGNEIQRLSPSALEDTYNITFNTYRHAIANQFVAGESIGQFYYLSIENIESTPRAMSLKSSYYNKIATIDGFKVLKVKAELSSSVEWTGLWDDSNLILSRNEDGRRTEGVLELTSTSNKHDLFAINANNSSVDIYIPKSLDLLETHIGKSTLLFSISEPFTDNNKTSHIFTNKYDPVAYGGLKVPETTQSIPNLYNELGLPEVDANVCSWYKNETSYYGLYYLQHILGKYDLLTNGRAGISEFVNDLRSRAGGITPISEIKCSDVYKNDYPMEGIL